MRTKLWKLCLVPVLALAVYVIPPPSSSEAACYCNTQQDCWNCYPFLAGEPVICRNHGCLWA